MDDIKVGGVVALASGGPPMTVINIADGKAECHWFNRSQDKMLDVFPVAGLKRYVAPVAEPKVPEK